MASPSDGDSLRWTGAATALGTPTRRPPGARPGVRVQGLERRRRGRDVRRRVHGRQPRGVAVRDDRPRGLRRLPGDAAAGQARRGPHARDRVAGVGGLRGAGAARAARPRDPHRAGALLPLARVLRPGRRAGRGARRPAGGHARRAARRRAALAPGRRHRVRLRSRRWSSALSLSGADLRGPDGDRRRAADRVRRGGDAGRVAVGGGPALRRRRAEPEGRARDPAPAREPGRRHRRRVRPRDGGGRLRAPGHAARSSSTPRCRRSSSASSAPPTRRRGRPTSPSSLPATCSRASSSASSASAAAAQPAARRE